MMAFLRLSLVKKNTYGIMNRSHDPEAEAIGAFEGGDPVSGGLYEH